MIGDRLSIHFLLFRYLVVAVVVAGLSSALRYRSPRLALVFLTVLGVVGWLFTWLPLERPYGLQPGSPSAFEAALVSSGAAGGEPLESWVSGRRNPRPAWSLLWFALCPQRPERAGFLLQFVAPLMLAFLPVALYLALRRQEDDDQWERLSCLFSALFASSVPLDVFRPFGVFYRSFFVYPHRGVALLIVLGAFALAWRGGWLRKAAAGVFLCIVGWIDLTTFAWGCLSLLIADILGFFQPGRPGGKTWPAALLGAALASPQIFALLRGEILMRGAADEEAMGYRIAFRDIFAASSDMEWLFLLAVAGLPLLWRRYQSADRGVLATGMASYVLWFFMAGTFHRGPLFEPDAIFHLLRFSVALAAGVGAYRSARWLIEHVGWAFYPEGFQGRLKKWIAGISPAPMAFVMLVIFLLPNSAPFLWHPLRMDPLYYPSLQPIEFSVRRLERWVLANTRPGEVILTGEATGEWIAALTGRRVLTAVQALPREQRRLRLRQMRALFLSDEPETMRQSLSELRATALVLDPSLRETYWQLDPAFLEQSGVFRKVHQIGDLYAIYRPR